MKTMLRSLTIALIIAFAVTACAQPAPTEAPSAPTEAAPVEPTPTEEPEPTPEPLEEVSLQLTWVKQGEYHGIFNAIEEGFFEDEGLDVTVHAGGPDIRPMALAAAGEVDFAVGGPATVIAGRSNDLPFVHILQAYQDSFTVYIAQKERGFETLEDIEGVDFGVWFGGGEWEPQLMADKAGVGKENVNWVPQKFSMIEFYEDKLDVASATLYNELHVVLDAGYSLDDLTIYRASDVGAAMVADGIYTTEKMIEEKPEVVQAMVNAINRGWKWGLENPEEAAEHVLKHNPELEYRKQLLQVEEVNKLITTRSAQEHGLGYMDHGDWEVAQETLLELEVIDDPMDLKAFYDLTFWENSPEEYRTLDDLDMDAIYARIEENLSK